VSFRQAHEARARAAALLAAARRNVRKFAEGGMLMDAPRSTEARAEAERARSRRLEHGGAGGPPLPDDGEEIARRHYNEVARPGWQKEPKRGELSEDDYAAYHAGDRATIQRFKQELEGLAHSPRLTVDLHNKVVTGFSERDGVAFAELPGFAQEKLYRHNARGLSAMGMKTMGQFAQYAEKHDIRFSERQLQEAGVGRTGDPTHVYDSLDRPDRERVDEAFEEERDGLTAAGVDSPARLAEQQARAGKLPRLLAGRGRCK
jgi:hypothetical protein